MTLIHISKQAPISDRYRILKKHCSLFDKEEYPNWESALADALSKHGDEFRIFNQTTYEGCQAINIEIIKVGKLKERE